WTENSNDSKPGSPLKFGLRAPPHAASAATQLVSFIQTTTVDSFRSSSHAVTLHFDFIQLATDITSSPPSASIQVPSTPSPRRFLIKTERPLVHPRGHPEIPKYL
ncbi:hypothetical protein N7535_005230, partial [Penicillium sp. DV-2018c]